MYTTGQFRVFATEPGERALARPRHLLREGRSQEAEDAYRTLTVLQPDLKLAWGEYFELLRSDRRFEEALELATRAAGQFGDDAFPVALRGAALVELGRYREGLTALEEAAGRDPNLGMVWHEAGYAAYRLGEHSRALMALDRAFALEPHSGTLHLRGKILRQAGRYLAAEVAFGGASEAAEIPEQRIEAERQIGVTRRYAAFPGFRPDDLSSPRRWFAETGAVLLTGSGEQAPPDEEALLQAFAELAVEEGWRFTSMVRTDGWAGWEALATILRLPLRSEVGLEDDGIPLVVSRRLSADQRGWERALRQIGALESGLSLVLHQAVDRPTADVVGLLDGAGRVRLDLAAAAEAVQHPESRLRGRCLR
ncbi:MAG: tetratricopeptide repeat protein [Gemmatimonadales bacterium]